MRTDKVHFTKKNFSLVTLSTLKSEGNFSWIDSIFITHVFTKSLRKYVLSRTSGNTWVCGWNCWHSKEQVFQLFKILCCTSYHSFLCNGIVSMWPRKSGFKNSRGDGFLSCWKWPPNLLWNCTLKRLPKTAVRQIIEMYVLMH